MKIMKAKETMTARERVRRAFQFEKTDRVTIGYEDNRLIRKNLMNALSVSDEVALKRVLGVDYIGVNARYIGPKLFDEIPNLIVDPLVGYRTRWIENSSGGGYFDACDFPLRGADDGAFFNYPIPNPDDFDYECIGEQIAQNRDLALHIGNCGLGDIINTMGVLMGMEDALCNLQLGHKPTLDLIRRRAEGNIGVLERILSNYPGEIDFMWMGEDLGTQIAPMISMELFRKHIKPIYKLFVEFADSYHIPTIIHTCGSSSWAYEDFIEMGVRGVDTLQPEAVNMSPAYLVEHFGGRLNFRGCISTAGPLAYGTPEEVMEYCKNTLSIMMPTRGYHFAPTHQIQDNTPAENVVAMYQAAHDFGVY